MREPQAYPFLFSSGQFKRLFMELYYTFKEEKLEVEEGIEPYQHRSSTDYKGYKASLHTLALHLKVLVPSEGLEPSPDWLRQGF